MISKNFNKFKSDDSGSTLVTVIVAIAFVTILTSIILGTTLVNVRMKGIDKRTRDDFYYAEKALNDIYTGIGMELAQTAGDDYEAAFLMVGGTDVNDEGDTVDYNFAEEAEKEFRNRFLKDANTFLTSLTATELQKYITSRGHVDKVGAVEYQKKDGGTPSNWAETSRVVLKNVQISDTDTSGYQAVVTTDIVVTVPTVDFLGTNADVSDYGLIANQGLYINGDTEINGNVYAGVHMITTSGYGENTTDLDYPFYESTDKNSRDRIFGGINIKDGTAQFTGNYIVSKGDINLGGTSPHLKVYTPAAGGDANLANLWYTSLRTNSKASLPTPSPSDPFADPTVYINANVFALNDLILNAQYSTVKIKGNYYGYNDKTVTGIDAADLIGRKTGRDDGESSAIIVNGSNAYLDMKDINNFVLMGKAYIDFTSDDYTNPTGTVNQVVPTAESVALKTNQQLYLVPNDFLNEPNPSTESATFTISIPSTDLQNWFGYPYLDSASIHSPYTVKLTDGTYIYYDYLMFNTDKTWRPEWTSPGVPERNADGTYKYTEVDESVAALGTGGSISSKSKFFLDIMTSKEAYDYAYDHRSTETPPSGVNFMAMSKDEYIDFKEESKVQPSAYRLYERVNLSMGYEYFDLGECVVGDGATDAHYYAKNAVVNYEKNPATHKIQSNVLNNTDGLFRYINYPQNLFRRYIYLCTLLDGKEKELLSADIADPDKSEWVVTSTDPAPEHAAPICKFVDMTKIPSTAMDIGTSVSSASGDGLKPGAFGVCIVQTGNLTINTANIGTGLVGNTFKGIAIVDGDITVDSGYNVDGLLMATGKITLKGGTPGNPQKINYNKGLIQSRIEKEMNIVKNSTQSKADAYKNYYIINYLTKDDGTTLLYDVEPGTKIKRDRIEADYNDFIFYENWQKGEK